MKIENQIQSLNLEVVKIKEQMLLITPQVNEMHNALMGNGKVGLLEKWHNLEGGLGVFKWIAGGGGLVGIIALIIAIMK